MKRKYLALALGLLTIMSLSACQTESRAVPQVPQLLIPRFLMPIQARHQQSNVRFLLVLWI